MSLSVNDLINFIITTKVCRGNSDMDWLDYPITVAFKDRDRVVVSDITSICFNGKSIQLNEEEFDKEVIA